MMRKVLFILLVYLFLMIVVSVSSDIVSVISDGAETAVYETPYPIHRAEPNDLTVVAAEVAVTSPTPPLGFTIKITEENEEEQSLLHFYSSIGILTNYNYVEEIEKRKAKVWYKRKFALCMIKNRIKRENGKTYSLIK